jgi:hypothetical protein
MLLMRIAYEVHGAIAQILPFRLSTAAKKSIKDAITCIEDIGTVAEEYSRPADKDD